MKQVECRNCKGTMKQHDFTVHLIGTECEPMFYIEGDCPHCGMRYESEVISFSRFNGMRGME